METKSLFEKPYIQDDGSHEHIWNENKISGNDEIQETITEIEASRELNSEYPYANSANKEINVKISTNKSIVEQYETEGNMVPTVIQIEEVSNKKVLNT